MIEEEITAFCEMYRRNLGLQNKIYKANELLIDRIEGALKKKFPTKISDIQIYGIRSLPYTNVEIAIDKNAFESEGFTLEDLLWIEKNTGCKYTEGGAAEGRYIFAIDTPTYENYDAEMMELETHLEEIHKECRE